ncbi:FAD-dependent oxidoreductase [Streptomyces sp. NPDC002004]
MPISPSEPAAHETVHDLAVIGAGPAGLAGAVTAAELGLRVALLDGSAQLGGQYYRHPAAGLGARRPGRLHHDWTAFTTLRDRLRRGSALYLPRHHVWAVTPGEQGLWVVHAVQGDDTDAAVDTNGAHDTGPGSNGARDGGDPGGADQDGTGRNGAAHGAGDPGVADQDGTGREGRSVRIRARTVLLATGAYERHLPFPGWTLPGVIGAGGAQAMLKSGLVLPGRRVVVAGSGPLLLAAAASLAAAGARVPAVVEAAGYLRYAARPRALAANPGKLAEAAVHGAVLLRHGVPVRTGSAVTRVHGTDRVEAVTVSRLDRAWRPQPGTGHRIPCDAVAVGHGLLPHTDLATALGCATRATPDGAHALVVDGTQETSVPGIFAAGETAGVGGARLARVEGELAARAVAARLLGVRPGGGALRRLRARARVFAEAMAEVHAPRPGWSTWLTGETEVCRCEEVPAALIHEAVDLLGARDARTVKLLTRAGMGWCQGRVCGHAVSCLAAGDGPPGEQGGPGRRLLAAPVLLGTLAECPPDD